MLGFLVVIFVQEFRITWYRERLKKSELLIPSLIPTLSDADFELNESHVTNLAVSTLSDEILQISAEPVKSNVMEMNPETCPIKDNTDWGVKIKSIYRKGCIFFLKTRKKSACQKIIPFFGLDSYISLSSGNPRKNLTI